ncbi:MAG TPA: TonB-dependent receptor [Terriglobales bacterium]|nr:TonB-dependent receptor [Terriglobales bacterium]
MKRFSFAAVSVLLSLVAFTSHSAYAQFADRAVITGVVTDASGAAIADAKVTVTNEGTGAQTAVGTNSAGNYSTPPLTLGSYRVDIEKQGFKVYSRPGIVLTGAVTYRQDAKLDVGSVTETVEVQGATELVNSENATVSHTVGAEYYKDLPAVMGADIRLAESLLQLQPGYVPVQPNGDAIFRGSQFESRINGGQMLATENWFDGAAFGYAEGHQQTQESSIPYPSVQEMTVVENTFSAQYGHTSGGFITYATKSGTNQFHGNLYDFYTNNKFDASNYFVGPLLEKNGRNNTLPLGQNNWGFDLGGPIPKLKKTFWFFNIDGLDYHSTVNTGLVNVLPDAKTRLGDFSEYLNLSDQVGTDALGRPMYKGEVFNPATTRLVGNVPVRDGYGFDTTTGAPIAGQANIIPANDPLRSSLAATVVPLIPSLDANSALGKPNEFGGTSDDNNKINVRTWLLRVDHTFNDKFSIANTYYENVRPRIAHCGGPGGCTTTNNGETDSKANDTYIGQGFYQRITNHFEHLQMNWVIKPNLFNHTTLAYDRWQMLGHQLSGGVGWNQKLGLGLPDEPIFNNAGFPQLNFNGPYGFTHYGTPWASQGADINNRYQFLDDVTWNTGKHTIKAGIEYRYMTFPQTGWAANTGGNFNFNDTGTAGFAASGAILNGGPTGNEFASFILGQVDGANFSVPFKFMPKMRYSSPWVNDDIKVTNKLNLTLGLRFDWTSGVSEEFKRFSTFDPSAQNPVGHLGATVFNASQATGKSSWSVGPRFGFAYSFDPKTVVRGGYGIYYAGVQADSWDPYPVDGYQTNPTISDTTGGRQPAFYFQGTGSCPANLTQLSGATISCGWPNGSIVLPGSQTLRPDIANGGNPVGVWPKTYTMPRYQNWSVSFQRELTHNMAIDIAYVGNHGTRLIDGRSSAGVFDNMNPDTVLQYGTALTNGAFSCPTSLDPVTHRCTVTTVPNAAAIAAGFSTPPYPSFTGDLAQALRSWPQYQQINWRSFPFGESHYNALQVAFERRMAAGLQLKASYTHSRLMNNGAESGLGAGGPPVQDPSNMKNLYTVSADDVPNVVSFGWIYKLPFGKGQRLLGGAPGVVNKLIGGWQISGVQSYSSGRPIDITMPNSLGIYLFNYARFPNVVGHGRNTNFSCDPGVLGAKGILGQCSQTYLNTSGWSDPGTTSNGLPAFGNAPRQDQNVRGFPSYNEDLSFMKDTYITERTYLRFHADAGNVFNRVYYCYGQTAGGSTVWSTGAFGNVSSQCNIPRRIQFALELFF